MLSPTVLVAKRGIYQLINEILDIADRFDNLPDGTVSLTIHEIKRANRTGYTRYTKKYYVTYEVKSFRSSVLAFFYGGKTDYIASYRLRQYKVKTDIDGSFLVPFKYEEKNLQSVIQLCTQLWNMYVGTTPVIKYNFENKEQPID